MTAPAWPRHLFVLMEVTLVLALWLPEGAEDSSTRHSQGGTLDVILLAPIYATPAVVTEFSWCSIALADHESVQGYRVNPNTIKFVRLEAVFVWLHLTRSYTVESL
ncbi:hypothetical protein F5Y18DRAFT_377656 [Xylariaceae sp. FL1019]|nr:hypothetical protein F5Y18DRAFT_377656 [Xylariaceae sp. FL1019]